MDMKFKTDSSVSFRFKAVQSVSFGFDTGGSYQPEPAPTSASALYGNAGGIASAVQGQLAAVALYGTATREE